MHLTKNKRFPNLQSEKTIDTRDGTELSDALACSHTFAISENVDKR